MEMLSGAEMVFRSLIYQGVKQVFCYPGGAVLDIYDALHTVGGIDHVLVRHEQAAVHMADGLARATGEVGVVLVTSGPGATNAITGIATAYMDSIPLVVLSGQVATSLIGYDAFQECDMVGISRPVVKHSFLVKQTEDIPQVLKKAFWLAASGRPGPVVVDLPKDILNPANKLPYVWPESVSMRSYNPTWSLIYRKIFLIRRTNYPMSGLSRSVCVLTIPLLPDIKGKLSVLCKRWWRQKNRLST